MWTEARKMGFGIYGASGWMEGDGWRDEGMEGWIERPRGELCVLYCVVIMI